jgi:hypothetical protein
MANLTSANVRVIQEWVEGDVYSKRRIGKRVEAHGVTVGGTTNLMPATAFGLKVIEEVTTPYAATTGHAVSAAPADDGSAMFLYTALNNATDPADAVIPATPGGLYFTVKGY